MKNNLNCPNCGHPILPEESKCPYCDTSYFDMSAIDLSEEKPFYLKFRTKDSNGKNIIITQFVKPRLTEMTLSADSVECLGSKGNPILSRNITSQTLSTNLELVAIPDKNNSLMTVIVEE